MSRWRLALLLFELLLFAAILILPQVELPATAFQGGTAPVAIKARASVVPVLAAALLPLGLLFSALTWEWSAERIKVPSSRNPHSRLALLCTLIC